MAGPTKWDPAAADDAAPLLKCFDAVLFARRPSAPVSGHVSNNRDQVVTTAKMHSTPRALTTIHSQNKLQVVNVVGSHEGGFSCP